MMEAWPATKKTSYHLTLKDVGQGYHLQKSLYLSYYTNDFNQTVIKMKAESRAIIIGSIIFY